MHLADLHDSKISDVTALPASVLATLADEYAALAARTKRIGAVLDSALELRYAAGINDTGTHHRDDGGYDVKITVPKRVDWDADKLNDMAASDELLEWLDFVPKVAESRYKAAPQRIQDQLDTARTVKAGKAKIEFKRKD